VSIPSIVLTLSPKLGTDVAKAWFNIHLGDHNYACQICFSDLFFTW